MKDFILVYLACFFLQLWMALASLCVLSQEHVERLSSGSYLPVSAPSSSSGGTRQPRPTCDNHDDGETPAIILCEECGNLCADCDRFLHLSRRMRAHQRKVFREEEEAVKVDLHEGCGRAKLFWVMCLADAKTHKAMAEFRESSKSASAVGQMCRFCGSKGAVMLPGIGLVCSDPECQV